MKLSLGLAMGLMCFSASSPGLAAWSAVSPVGNTQVATSNPVCVSIGPSDAICAMANVNHRLTVNRFTSGVWSGWSVLAATITSDPSCFSRSAGDAVCVARGTGVALVSQTLSGGVWGGPVTLAGSYVYSAPSCAAVDATHGVCAARGPSGGLTASELTGSAWGAFTTLPSQTVFAPGCASDASGGVICSVVANTGHVLVDRFLAGVWNGFIDTGGQATGPTTCASFGVAGQVVCYARGQDTGAYGNLFKGPAWNLAGWGGWASIGGGKLQSDLSCASGAAQEQTCTTIGQLDGALYGDEYNAGAWHGFAAIGGTLIGNPSCTTIATRSVLCVAVGIDNRLRYTVGP